MYLLKERKFVIVLQLFPSSSIYMMVVMPSCCKVLEVLGVPLGILGGEEVIKIEKIQVSITGRA